MITCEQCSADVEHRDAETVQVQLQDSSRRQCSLCISCWDASEPGEWLKLAEGIEVQRLYWICDLCEDVCRYDAVRVMVYATQAPPRTEYIVCEDCERRAEGALQPKEPA